MFVCAWVDEVDFEVWGWWGRGIFIAAWAGVCEEPRVDVVGAEVLDVA